MGFCLSFLNLWPISYTGGSSIMGKGEKVSRFMFVILNLYLKTCRGKKKAVGGKIRQESCQRVKYSHTALPYFCSKSFPVPELINKLSEHQVSHSTGGLANLFWGKRWLSIKGKLELFLDSLAYFLSWTLKGLTKKNHLKENASELSALSHAENEPQFNPPHVWLPGPNPARIRHSSRLFEAKSFTESWFPPLCRNRMRNDAVGWCYVTWLLSSLQAIQLQ